MPLRIARFAAFTLIPLVVFLALFHPAILDITNAGWLIRGTDGGENALGLHAWLHDTAASYSLHTSLLNAPEGTSLLFTDSNPLLALLLRPVAGMLPADTQVIGWWLLLCCVLQAAFAWGVLRRHAPGFLALWCGVALLCALPTWYNRFVHANLFGHWLILCALWLFLEPVRGGRNRWWGPLIVVTALIHNYLLLMVAAVWASAMLASFLTARQNRARLELIAGSAAIMIAVAAIAAAHGAGGSFALIGNYGVFSMPLDALWNPANPGYGTILPAIPQRAGRGYEGFQYLGLGILILLALAVIVARRIGASTEQAAVLKRLRWLIPALIVLTLLAISNYPGIAGRNLGIFELPHAMAPFLDMIRSSGRLFWPVAYVLVIVAILAIYRLDTKRAGQVLAVLLAIQAIDLAAMTSVVRGESAEADNHRLYRRTLDARWDRAIAAAHDVTFVPADAMRDFALFQEVAWRATTLGRPMRFAYTARVDRRSAERIEGENARFAAGDIDPRRLYVLLAGTPVPAVARTRLRVIDGARVLVPVSASLPR